MNEEKQNTGTGERIRIGNSCLTVEICLRGAELYAVRPAEGGDSYLWSGDPSIWSGRAPILFPICGALREDTYMHEGVQYRMDKHGFASGMRFEAVETGREHAVLRLEDSETTRAMYPFSFALTVRYALAERTLEVTYAVENRGGEPLYYSIGAHEGFALPEGVRAYEVHFDEREDMTAADLAGPYLAGTHRRILPEDGRVLPLDPEQFGPDALIFLAPASRGLSLCRRDGTRVVRVEFPDFPHLLLWQVSGAPFLCVEPWSGLPDYTDSSGILSEKPSITVLAPHATHQYRHRLIFGAQPTM